MHIDEHYDTLYLAVVAHWRLADIRSRVLR